MATEFDDSAGSGRRARLQDRRFAARAHRGHDDGDGSDSTDGRHDARFGVALGAIAVAALVIRLAYDALVEPHLGIDAIWYVLQAGTIASGHGYVDPGTFYSFRGAVATANFPPLWPALLAVVNTVWSDSFSAYRATGAVLGAGTVVLTGMIARRILTPRAALCAAVITAVSPLLIAADGSVMAESLFTLLVTGALLVSYLVIARPTPIRWIALGALFGAAALTRADALFIAPFVIGAVALRTRAGFRSLTGPLVAVVALVLVMTPWMIRNHDRIDGFVGVSTNSGSLLEGANCARVYGGAEIGTWDSKCLRRSRAPGRTEKQQTDGGISDGTGYARDHLARLAVVAPVRVLRGWGFWSPTAQARLEAEESRAYHWQLVAWGPGLLLLLLGVGGCVVLARRHVEVAPLVAVLLAATLLLAASWGNSRFRVFVEPALAVAAVGGLSHVRRGRRVTRPGDPQSAMGAMG